MRVRDSGVNKDKIFLAYTLSKPTGKNSPRKNKEQLWQIRLKQSCSPVELLIMFPLHTSSLY
jgi:hypothetical protein